MLVKNKNKSLGRKTRAHADPIAIHSSYDALVNVVKALMRKRRFAPYRDSQVTNILRKCLDGEGKICILVTISPCRDKLHETISSLCFGSCCMKIEFERFFLKVQSRLRAFLTCASLKKDKIAKVIFLK